MDGAVQQRAVLHPSQPVCQGTDLEPADAAQPSAASALATAGGQPAMAEQALLTAGAMQHPPCTVPSAPPPVGLPAEQGGGLADFDVMIEAPAAAAGGVC